MHYNENLMIIMKGTVQVRVIHRETNTNTTKDLWFSTLRQGSCFNVYNSFNPLSQSLVYFIADEDCIIEALSLSDLKTLALSNFELS